MPVSDPSNVSAIRDTHGATGEGWYGFDLDGTLAMYDGWKGIDHIGEPITPMVELMKRMHDAGEVVKIMTARVAPRENPETCPNPWFPGVPSYTEKYMKCGGSFPNYISAFYSRPEWSARDFVVDWCLRHLGFLPDITHQKDGRMIVLYDDRVKQVVPNTGILVENLAGSGNTAALREALEKCRDYFYDLLRDEFAHKQVEEQSSNPDMEDFRNEVRLHKAVESALAAPPRNCDVKYADEVEMYGAFKDWCKAKGHTMEPMLAYDAFEWLLDTAKGEVNEKGEPK